MQVKAAVLYELGGRLEVEDVELADPKEGEVLVKVAASGVCHSDISVIDGVIPFPLPAVLGHEGAGVVESVGPGVDQIQPGDHVIFSFIPACGQCFYCLRGKSNLCEPALRLGGNLYDGTSRLTNGKGHPSITFHHLRVSPSTPSSHSKGRSRLTPMFHWTSWLLSAVA